MDEFPTFGLAAKPTTAIKLIHARPLFLFGPPELNERKEKKRAHDWGIVKRRVVT